MTKENNTNKNVIDTTESTDDFINMFKRFLQNQNQLNQYLANTTQQQQTTNDHLQTLVTETSNAIELADGSRCESRGSVSNVAITMQSFVDVRNDIEVLPIQKYDLILGKPWLYDLNPRINWKNNQISIKKDNCIYKIKAEVKEDMNEYHTNLLSRQQFAQEAKNTAELYAVFSVEDSGKEIKEERVSEFLKELVEEYQDVFPDELPRNLPPERNIDHEIPLQEGTSPPYGPIYKMSVPEMKELKKQIEDYMNKGVIRPSTSLQARWVETLQAYNFTIKYRPGRNNVVADALSRKPEANAITEINIETDMYERIKKEYEEDTYLQRIIKALKDSQCEEAKKLGKQGVQGTKAVIKGKL
ncbi:8884_t:CDS:2 [Cetraspora pellucida]|uniref:8884_t:CDS:1 n=1 Tax=Cetraspora pellucida TaxID=1433469 RepID=A0A9N9N9M2_9GLOM|nr:8884_t:CDS:2 [Cetraspora pellucida]